MGLKRFLLIRFAATLFTLFAIVTLLFLIVRLVPGDPTQMFINEAVWSDPAAIQRQRELWGLNDPIYIQYLRYLWNLVTFQFGQSFTQGISVRPIIIDKLLNTIVMMGPSVVLMVVLGAVWGAVAGWRRGSRFEQISAIVSLATRAVPSFFLAIIVLMIFSYNLRWFPSGGMVEAGTNLPFLQEIFSLDFLRHLILPTIVLVLRGANESFLLMRTSIIEVKGEDFFETLWAKGLSEPQVIRHAIRNAILPLITYIAVISAFLFEGQVLIETIFAWPGIGRQIVTSLMDHDYPVAQAGFFLTALVVVSMNLVVDVLYGYLDPRVKY
ncbi:MAG: ABC transporter permease [Chloroflexi bacterium]|nr:ABC transporter permease [Chloroflexota bacterium]